MFLHKLFLKFICHKCTYTIIKNYEKKYSIVINYTLALSSSISLGITSKASPTKTYSADLKNGASG
jgi:hypothetical protein